MCGGACLLLSLGMAGAWYVWDARAVGNDTVLNWVLLALLVLVPCALVTVLAGSLLRAEPALRAMRTPRGQSVLSQVADNDALEDDLRDAMRGNGQLYVHYQPIFHASTRTVAGFEALVRWNHPTRGPVAPMQFIPVAEQTELIVPLGAWVLETACAEAARWPDSWYISVNLSPIQLEKVHLVRDVKAALDRSGLPAERLELEVTEGVLVAAESGEIARLAELRRSGVLAALVQPDEYAAQVALSGCGRPGTAACPAADRSPPASAGAASS